MRVYGIKGIVAVWVCVLSFLNVKANDSTLFIGRVWYIEESNEFYTSLNFKKGIDETRANKLLMNQLDSTVSDEKKIVN